MVADWGPLRESRKVWTALSEVVVRRGVTLALRESLRESLGLRTALSEAVVRRGVALALGSWRES